MSPHGGISLMPGSFTPAMWEFGTRHGVLIQKITHKVRIKGEPDVPFDENWNIVWFNAAAVPIEGRSLS